MKEKRAIILIVLMGCIVMGFIDAVVRPQYFIKSMIKIIFFLATPIFYAKKNKQANLKSLFQPDRKGIFVAILSGAVVFTCILGAYFLLGAFFDLSHIQESLAENTGVNTENFLFVAVYISLVNSLLEEFFFRGFAFLKLKEQSTRKFAYIFSSAAFAFYHVAMMIGWFDIFVFVLAISALFIGGLLFGYFNEKYGNIYVSWLIHMFANFAVNLIGFILFGMV